MIPLSSKDELNDVNPEIIPHWVDFYHHLLQYVENSLCADLYLFGKSPSEADDLPRSKGTEAVSDAKWNNFVPYAEQKFYFWLMICVWF